MGDDVLMIDRRPATVAIVAVFLFAATAIAAVVAVSLLVPNTWSDRLWQLNPPAQALFQRLGRAAAVFLLLLACSTLLCALALLRRRQWAWRFAVALFAISASGDVVSLASTGDWVRGAAGVLVSLVFVVGLCRASVRSCFGIDGSAQSRRGSRTS